MRGESSLKLKTSIRAFVFMITLFRLAIAKGLINMLHGIVEAGNSTNRSTARKNMTRQRPYTLCSLYLSLSLIHPRTEAERERERERGITEFQHRDDLWRTSGQTQEFSYFAYVFRYRPLHREWCSLSLPCATLIGNYIANGVRYRCRLQRLAFYILQKDG